MDYILSDELIETWYSCRILNGKKYIIDQCGGATFEVKGGYPSLLSRYEEIPEWKREAFYIWFFRSTKKVRKKIVGSKSIYEYKQEKSSFDECCKKADAKKYLSKEDFMKARKKADCSLTHVPVINNGAFELRKEEKNMRTTTTVETDDNAKRYLIDRLYEARLKKDQELEKTFGLANDPTPNTAKELIARITAGKYVLDKRVEEDCDDDDWDFYYGNALYGITWRDPAIKKDKEGYKTATTKLREAYSNAMDEIKVFDAEKGLETLRTFQSATFH